MERIRINKLLAEAVCSPVVVVCAGSGYGKTKAVSAFVRGFDCYTTWIQLSELDNVKARYWETVSNSAKKSWPEYGAALLEIGFPETDAAFAQFAELAKGAAAFPKKHLIVYDDFHLLNNPDILNYVNKSWNILPPNTVVIILTRTMPEINIIGMVRDERVYIIDENALRFTEDEIAEYFKLLQLAATRTDIHNIHADTKGWCFAVSLIANSLVKDRKYERYVYEAMKKNIFRLIDSEIYQHISEPLQRFLLRLSLIDHLATDIVREIAGNDALVAEMETLHAYIRYDFILDTYMIHSLFLDFLRQRQHALTEEERRDTYKKASVWCDANGYRMDALAYYEKCGNYAKIVKNMVPANLQIPQDMALFVIEIMNRAPEGEMMLHPQWTTVYTKMMISLGRLDEAIATAHTFVRKYEDLPETVERNIAIAGSYGNLGLALRNMCTYTDNYDFDVYFKKMGEYYDRTPFIVYNKLTSQLPVAFCTLVGSARAGALEEYIEAIARCIPDVSRVLDGLLTGYDDLLRGELCFHRGQFDNAEKHFWQSIKKATERGQYLIVAMALSFLMAISFFRGDLTSATNRLRDIEAMTCIEDFDIRYEIADISKGFYFLSMQQPEQIPEWLKGDFSPYAHPSYLDNFGNRVKARYHYVTGKYNELLAFINNACGRQNILFGKIELYILKAMSLYKIKRPDEALTALIEACALAKPNKIITPFIQKGTDMRTLAAAALKKPEYTAHKDWLTEINRKSSSLAKRRASLLSKFREAHNLNEAPPPLSKREINVLADLAKGLSRPEIAAAQDISVNTVKMVVCSIYNKLDVNSMAEAIKTAAERRII